MTTNVDLMEETAACILKLMLSATFAVETGVFAMKQA